MARKQKTEPEQPAQAPEQPGQKVASFAPKSIPAIENDIASFRTQNNEFDAGLKAADRASLEDHYLLKQMVAKGYEVTPTSDIQRDLAAFREANPLLDQRAKELPRERLENSYALDAMRKQGYNPAVAKAKHMFNHVFSEELKNECRAAVAHIKNEKFAHKVMFEEKIPKIAKKHGLKF